MPSIPGAGIMLAAVSPSVSMINAISSLGLLSGLQLCLDAGDGSSYGGTGQTWMDRSGNSYNFYRGATSSPDSADPTFHGTSGNDSANEYWAVDGGDYFTLNQTNPAWVNNYHKNNAKFTVCGWAYLGSVSGGETFIGDHHDTATGFNIYATATSLGLVVRNDSGSTVLNQTTFGSGVLPANQWFFWAVSINEATGADGLAFVINGSAYTYTSTYTSPSTGSAPQTLIIAAAGGGTSPMPAGSRVASLSAWEGVTLTTANLASIYAATRGTFGV